MLVRRTKRFRKSKIVMCCSAAAVVLLVTLFLLKGWIRSTLVPTYADHFYLPGIVKNFDQDFTDVNSEFSKLEFGFIKDSSDITSYKECGHGASAYFEGFNETVPCYVSQGSDRFSFTGEFVGHWKQASLSFENYLLDHGWHKDWNTLQPIEEIYNNPKNNYSVAVNYSKTHGKTVCKFSVVYNAYASDLDKTYAVEVCARNVAFFGGYQ